MSSKENEKVNWKIEAEYIDSCNCDWGCPCQFMAPPTHGNCDGASAFLIARGNYGSVSLDGLSGALILSYPGAVHEGHGVESIYIDEKADEAQFWALAEIMTGAARGGPFEIYSHTCDRIQVPRRARIDIEPNGVKSRICIRGTLEIELEPIRNPVTHEEHRAIIELPGGFEADRMEQASSKKLVVTDELMRYSYHDSYGSLSHVKWKGPR